MLNTLVPRSTTNYLLICASIAPQLRLNCASIAPIANAYHPGGVTLFWGLLLANLRFRLIEESSNIVRCAQYLDRVFIGIDFTHDLTRNFLGEMESK
jgi:hypothetical protein